MENQKNKEKIPEAQIFKKIIQRDFGEKAIQENVWYCKIMCLLS